MRSAFSNHPFITTGIALWYEMKYQSVCSGMRKTDLFGSGENQNRIICVHQEADYTSSLAQTLGRNAVQLLQVGSSDGKLNRQ
jgi:hypothetical protein